MTTYATDFDTAPKIDTALVEAYGCEMAPLVNYANYSKKIASEFVIKYAGKKRRVYSWLTIFGKDAMYVLVKGVETFLPPEVETMLFHGKPSYDQMTPVAATVAVLN